MWQVCTLIQPAPGRHKRHADEAVTDAEEMDCWPVATQQGSAFEVNNALPHKVQSA